MALLALPNELLLLAASRLSTRDLASFILVNRRLCFLLTPTLIARARQDHRALHHAVLHGHHDVMQLYLSRGVPASIVDSNSYSALQVAVGRGDEVAVRLLLDHDAAPGGGVPADSFMASPLLWAVGGKSEEIVRMLLEAGADPSAVGRRRILPMYALYSSKACGRRGEGWEERVAAMMVQYGASKSTVHFS